MISPSREPPYTGASDIRISVALVTRNRPDALEQCLRSWSAQTVPPYEIVVSDDSDDTFAPQIEELSREHGCVYTRGPRRGLYANRNHVALACSGTHIVSADDDHTHPTDYVERLRQLVAEDPRRIWTLPERAPHAPDMPPAKPTELHRSGVGCEPADPSDCAAIADGATLYPREVFDRGLRYDETYKFGNIWYLWGKVLVRNGWRISCSDATYVWHHAWTERRLDEREQVSKQLECMTYVLFVNALWINRSLINLFWACAYLLRRMIFRDSIVWYTARVRISPRSAWRALSLAWTYPERLAASSYSQEFT